MKVLHIVKTAVGANWAYEQVCVLCSLGIEVVVALPSDTEGLAPKYREAGAAVLRANLDFPAREPWRIPAALRACRQLVADVRPDLIHTHHVGPTFITRLALGKNSPLPRVFQVPGPLHLEHPFFAWLDVTLAGARDSWIATCRWTHQKYLDLGIPSDRVFLSYTGTNTEPFTGLRTGLLRKELGISARVPLVGMVAYMYAPKRFLGQRRGLKGHEDFIAALCLARETNPNIRAVIIGGPWGRALRYDRRLRKLGAKAGNGWLDFLGTRRDIPDIYPDLDLAVVPSHSENCGGAIEPLLSGVPVVATSVGGLPDLIQEDKTGWLVPPRKPQELARAILESLQNPAESRCRAIEGQKLANTMFQVKTTGREVAAIYEKILRPQTNPSLVDSIESHDRLGSKPPEPSEIAARATGQR
jgi:glycosyltransferase involved in cell wall biosynthesis